MRSGCRRQCGADLVDRRRQQAGFPIRMRREQRLWPPSKSSPPAADHQRAIGPFGDQADIVGDHQDCRP